MDQDQLPATDRRLVLTGLAATGLSMLPGSRVWGNEDTSTDYERARELYRYAYPLIYFARYRHRAMTEADALTRERLVINQWSHNNRTVTPETSSAPQTDTLYSVLIADLRRGPRLLSIPRMDGRYWSIQCCDFLGATFGMINRRNTQGPTTIALVGSGWRGRLPGSVSAVYRSPTPWVYALMRTHFVSDTDREQMITLRSGFTSAGLSGSVASKPSRHASTLPFVPHDRSIDPLADFRLLTAMWRDCPPPGADAATLRRFTPLGFGPGARPDIDRMSPKLRDALARAEADGFAEISIPNTSNISRTANGWTVPNPDQGLYRNKDYLYRARTAHHGIIATPTSENVYMGLMRDPDGSPLIGSNRYEVTFDAASLTEAGAFWSIHAYRLPAMMVIPNPMNRYSISSRTPGLKFNADGSLTIFVQADDAGGTRSSNWLPVRSGEAFALTTRAYEPKGAIARLEWPGPKVVRIDEKQNAF